LSPESTSHPPTNQQSKTAPRQLADDRKLKAIQSALRRDFAAPSTADGGDSNPLLRRSKLSATNPLLGDSSDDEFG
jgi:hypothetical protein